MSTPELARAVVLPLIEGRELPGSRYPGLPGSVHRPLFIACDGQADLTPLMIRPLALLWVG